jgi:Skp family chaperone for outer membrane proteins
VEEIMKIDHRATAILAVLLAGALAVGAAQEKPPAGARSGVLNVRECMDAARNAWMAEIDQELLKMQEAAAGRASDLNPQERARIRTKYLDHSNRRRVELYAALVRIAGEVARERGLDLVHRIDRMPAVESGDPDLMAQIYSRDIIHADPGMDITGEVLARINKEHAGRKK